MALQGKYTAKGVVRKKMKDIYCFSCFNVRKFAAHYYI